MIITLKKLEWGNMFSYGANNSIELDSSQITQIVGKNGHGKSSIPLILEETIYNKNSKGIKKASIPNRYTKDKKYSSFLEFTADMDTYQVSTHRASTQSIKITKNGVDISAHTATATLELLEKVLGIDYKGFTQLVYQSSSKSLEFLTATDTARKKFLIDLLNLSHYTEIFDKLKEANSQVVKDIAAAQRAVDLVESWLAKNANEDLSIKQLLPSASVDVTHEVSEVHDLKAVLKAADEDNKKITQNNQYRSMLDSIDVEQFNIRLGSAVNTSELISSKATNKKIIKDADTLISKINGLSDTCPTCLQTVSKEFTSSLLAEQQELRLTALKVIQSVEEELAKAEALNAAIEVQQKNKSQWELYNSLYDCGLQDDLVDKSEVSLKIAKLEKSIADALKTIDSTESANRLIEKHNSRVIVIIEQMDSMKADLEKFSKELSTLNARTNRLQILQKAFSTSGLVAYKIECMVKDLEDLVNVYLADLSSGRFQLSFKIVSDKLNVIITDNGQEIEITALSNGELARVNTATLLAIRKLMQQLASTKINLLILDETIDALDVDGKEKLVEVLLKEEHLNTFLVSHGFTHPLLDKLSVIKENNISRIEV